MNINQLPPKNLYQVIGSSINQNPNECFVREHKSNYLSPAGYCRTKKQCSWCDKRTFHSTQRNELLFQKALLCLGISEQKFQILTSLENECAAVLLRVYPGKYVCFNYWKIVMNRSFWLKPQINSQF